MECKKVHNKIIFFLEKELPDSEMKQVQEHLNICSDCARFMEEMQLTLSMLETEKSPVLNPFFYTRLKAKLENQESEQKLGFWRPAFLRVLQPAAFSILLIAGIYTGIKVGQPAPTKQFTATLMQNQEIQYLNEMASETIETSLME